MYRRLTLIAAAVGVAALAACGPVDNAADTSAPMDNAADTSVVSTSPGAAAAGVPASPTAGISSDSDGDGAGRYVRAFHREFPDLASGKTDAQILSDGRADCSDMATSRKVATPSMAQRYGLGNSTIDQAVLNNIGLLAMFTICPAR
ncbi:MULTISPECIES: hypothetical protein [unclassified Pseudofrankia]|uniref:hypothetical protein n=1 Tax=unclassified Pseudofrankia TaxID=2994372 RepID=UPI0008DA0A91|nr:MULTISPECIES: hypothetical protein [unclassified Pseudofrankia]MDT3444561.1 hypothetical protein [Pseudofrankia sp. BMG5.37]OHV56427.1 hypothetical protein BCD48_08080 [Pseudofrankia sp. BMG5.36]